MNDYKIGILSVLIYLYILVSQIFAAYFWYEFAQDHGFLSTLFIGPIVGEIKGLLFPFFI
jgi:hypothetical protein